MEPRHAGFDSQNGDEKRVNLKGSSFDGFESPLFSLQETATPDEVAVSCAVCGRFICREPVFSLLYILKRCPVHTK